MESWVYKQGEASGIEKGRLEGIEKGRLEGGRNAIVPLYEARFGTMPADLQARVAAIETAAVAARWLEIIAHSPKEEVDAALAAG